MLDLKDVHGRTIDLRHFKSSSIYDYLFNQEPDAVKRAIHKLLKFSPVIAHCSVIYSAENPLPNELFQISQLVEVRVSELSLTQTLKLLKQLLACCSAVHYRSQGYIGDNYLLLSPTGQRLVLLLSDDQYKSLYFTPQVKTICNKVRGKSHYYKVAMPVDAFKKNTGSDNLKIFGSIFMFEKTSLETALKILDAEKVDYETLTTGDPRFFEHNNAELSLDSLHSQSVVDLNEIKNYRLCLNQANSVTLKPDAIDFTGCIVAKSFINPNDYESLLALPNTMHNYVIHYTNPIRTVELAERIENIFQDCDWIAVSCKIWANSRYEPVDVAGGGFLMVLSREINGENAFVAHD